MIFQAATQLSSILSIPPFRILGKVDCALELLLPCSVEKSVNESMLLWEVSQVQQRIALRLFMVLFFNSLFLRSASHLNSLL